MSSIFDRLASQNDSGDRTDEQSPPEAAPMLNDRESVASAQTTLGEVKNVVQELLRHGYLEEDGSPLLFRSIVIYEERIEEILEPLDLELRLDSHRGVAFLLIAKAAYQDTDDGAVWAHPLVRRQRMTLEQSLVVAMLRQAFIVHEQESGVGEGPAKITVDELLPQFLTYLGDSGSDAKNESRLLSLLDQLKPHGIVSEVDKNQQLTIRPLIVYLANPESLTSLLREFQNQAQASQAARSEE